MMCVSVWMLLIRWLLRCLISLVVGVLLFSLSRLVRLCCRLCSVGRGGSGCCLCRVCVM